MAQGQPGHFAWSPQKPAKGTSRSRARSWGGSETLLAPRGIQSWSESLNPAWILWMRTHTYLTPQPSPIPPFPSFLHSPLSLLPSRPWLHQELQQLAGTRLGSSRELPHPSRLCCLELMRAPQVRAVTHSPHFRCFHMAAPPQPPSPANYSRSIAPLLPPRSQLHYPNEPTELSPAPCTGHACMALACIAAAQPCLGQRWWEK